MVSLQVTNIITTFKQGIFLGTKAPWTMVTVRGPLWSYVSLECIRTTLVFVVRCLCNSSWVSKIYRTKRWIRNVSEPYEYPWSKWGINVTFSYIYSNFWHNDNNCIAFHSWSCLLGDSRTTCKVMGSHKPGTVLVPETGSAWSFEPWWVIQWWRWKANPNLSLWKQPKKA